MTRNKLGIWDRAGRGLLVALLVGVPVAADQLPQNVAQINEWLVQRIKPLKPVAVSPKPGADDVATSALEWTALGAVTCDVWFGTSSRPPQVATAVPCGSYVVKLDAQTTYHWKVRATNTKGSETSDTWSFSTTRLTYDLTAVVLDASGRPIPGAHVTALGPQPLHPSADKRTADGNGFVHFPVYGSTDFRLEATGYQTVERNLPPWSESHRVHLARAIPEPGDNPRKGRVRLCGRAFCDDLGEWNALGVTLMWAANGVRTTPDQLDQNLRWARTELGADYIRALSMVGAQPAWRGREIVPNAAGYWDDIEQVTRRAWAHGLRVEWTLFADAQVMMPRQSDRLLHVDRFVDELVQRDLVEMVLMLEISNEYWVNGFSGREGVQQLRELAARARSRMQNHGIDIPLAIGSPEAPANDAPEPCAEITPMYDGSAATMTTPHFSRLVTLIDGIWRHVRQPWEWRQCPGSPQAGTNNEPLGPGSSIAEDDDPLSIVSAAVTSYVSGMAGYVYHSEAGVWGGLRGPANLWEHDRAPAIARALRAMTAYLPAGLANWTKTRHAFADHPFAASFSCSVTACTQIWPDGGNSGVVRAYAAYKGKEFVVVPTGVLQRFVMRPTAPMRFRVLDLFDGGDLMQGNGSAGSETTLSNQRSAYVVIGQWQ